MYDKIENIDNPHGVDFDKPYIFHIRVLSAAGIEYGYIGKRVGKQKLGEYSRYIRKILNGEPCRPSEPKYRYVYLVLTKANQEGWPIKCTPIANCTAAEHNEKKRFYMRQYNCNMNGGKSWFVEEYEKRAEDIS